MSKSKMQIGKIIQDPQKRDRDMAKEDITEGQTSSNHSRSRNVKK